MRNTQFVEQGGADMYSGKELWKDYISYELKPFRISETRVIETYENLPENLYRMLQETARRMPDKTAVTDDCGHACMYRELLEKTDRFSSWLHYHSKIRHGQHAALMLYNSLEFCVAFLALNKLGVVVIPMQTKYRRPEIEALLDKADASLILTDPDFKEWFSSYKEAGLEIISCSDIHSGYGWSAYEDSRDCEMEGTVLDDALLVFTSGTTSRSKGVMIRNFNISHAIVSYQKTLKITEKDVTIIPVPLYLITGLIALFGLFVYVGGSVFIHQFFSADQVLSCVQKENVTFIHASPTVFSLLLETAPKFPPLPSLVKFACGSSNMPKEKIRQLHRWLPKSSFHTVYGLTETTSPGTIFPTDASVSPYIGSSGIPIPGMNIKILRDDGTEAEPGETGEIHLNGANLLDSYYRMETPLLQENWLDTGDLGYVNEEGYLFIVDRKKDMINRGGEKICSFDVENEIYRIDGVLDAAVVAIPDAKYGEVPAALIRTTPEFDKTEEEMKALLKTRLASYQVPVRICKVSKIPVTPNNKIDKKYIRTHFEEYTS